MATETGKQTMRARSPKLRLHCRLLLSVLFAVPYCLYLILFSSHGYHLFLGLHKEHWLALERALIEAKNAPKEPKDSSPASESSRQSRQSSTSKDEDRPGDDDEEEFEGMLEEDKNEYECVLS